MGTNQDVMDIMPNEPDQQAAELAFVQFQQREYYNQQAQESVLNELAAVLHPRTTCTPSPEGAPLLIAMRAIGETLGVTIQAPMSSAPPPHRVEPLLAIIEASHLRHRPVVLANRWWTKASDPLLAYQHKNPQPVALLPISATRYELFDPIRMTRRPVNEQVAATLKPMAYMFYRPFDLSLKHWRELIGFGLRGHRRELETILIMGLATTGLGMLTPQATAILVDHAIPDAERGIVLQLGMALLASTFGQALFWLAKGTALIRQQTSSVHAIQTAMWDRLLRLSPSFFRHYTTGDLQVRLAAVHTIHQKLSGSTLLTLLTSLLSFFHLALMLYYNAKLAMLACGIALVVLSATTYWGVRAVRYTRLFQALQGEISGTLIQLINGINKLRVAGAETRAFAHWGHKFSRQQRLLQQIQRIEDHVTVFNSIISVLASALLFWYTLGVVRDPASLSKMTMSAGTFLAFYTAFGTFMGGVTSLSNTIIDVVDVATLWERCKPFIQQKPEVDRYKRDPGWLTGRLTVEHVTFKYQAQGPIVLENINLHAEPGDFIALVGSSGSGKSTLLRLLLGFDTPQTGTILFDDQTLTELNITSVRRQIGTVLQQSRIMSASIFDNIAGGIRVSVEDAWTAAWSAGLGEDIMAMPMKMHTFISEGGTNLSGGQRQRLLIARALVSKPTIVLFDEATSALDNRTQAIVTESLEKLQATRVVIAHRLSTIRDADRIYVFDKGKIVQQGGFEELSQQEGRFAQLIA